MFDIVGTLRHSLQAADTMDCSALKLALMACSAEHNQQSRSFKATRPSQACTSNSIHDKSMVEHELQSKEQRSLTRPAGVKEPHSVGTPAVMGEVPDSIVRKLLWSLTVSLGV